jgi:hypothetical protein
MMLFDPEVGPSTYQSGECGRKGNNEIIREIMRDNGGDNER